MYKNFRLARYKLKLIAGSEGLELPVFKGSAFRGNFGDVFRRITCNYKNNNCDDCPSKIRCAYSYIFNTSPPVDAKALSRYQNIPRPFIIEPPFNVKRTYLPNEEIILYITLIGKAIDFLPYFIIVFVEMGEAGIGKHRRKFKLENISAVGLEHEAVTYNANENVLKPVDLTYTWADILNSNNGKVKDSGDLNVNFLTPTCLKNKGTYIKRPEFHILFRQVMRRVSALSYFHQDYQLEADYSGLAERARSISTAKLSTIWQDWDRFSGHQRRFIPMGGIVGSVIYTGDVKEFLPWLSLGEHIHVGKNTVFGQGRFAFT